MRNHSTMSKPVPPITVPPAPTPTVTVSPPAPVVLPTPILNYIKLAVSKPSEERVRSGVLNKGGKI